MAQVICPTADVPIAEDMLSFIKVRYVLAALFNVWVRCKEAIQQSDLVQTQHNGHPSLFACVLLRQHVARFALAVQP